MRKRNYISALAVAAMTLISGVSAFAQDNYASPEELFAQANAQFDSSNYIEAIGLYHKILESGQESAALYYNLGNAYYEAGDLGYAILNFLRAQRLAPGDPDIQDNLNFARRFVSVQMEGVKLNPFTDFLSSITSRWSLDTWGWLSSALFFVLCGLLFVRIMRYSTTRIITLSTWAALVVFLAAAGLTSFKYRTEFTRDRAVVVMPSAPVTSRPAPDSELEFEAVAGLEVEIREESDGYALALFENKRQGWVPLDAVARL